MFWRQEPRLRQEALCRTSQPAPSPPPHHLVLGAHPISEAGVGAQCQDLSELIPSAPCSLGAGVLSALPPGPAAEPWKDHRAWVLMPLWC